MFKCSRHYNFLVGENHNLPKSIFQPKVFIWHFELNAAIFELFSAYYYMSQQLADPLWRSVPLKLIAVLSKELWNRIALPWQTKMFLETEFKEPW